MALSFRAISSTSCVSRSAKAFRSVTCNATPMRPHQQLQQQQQQTSPVSRRALLSATATTALWLSRQRSAMAAYGASCTEFKTAPNGLQWCETSEGTGPAPVKGSLIRCHYNGRLKSNGVVFDSSYERGRPLSFKIGNGEVIRGWDIGILGSEVEGIPPMKEGGKRTIVIPAELGYGQRGAGGVIPPNAVLEFDVELLARR